MKQFKKKKSLFSLLVSAHDPLPHCFGPEVRQTIMAARLRGGTKVLTSWGTESKEREQERAGLR